MEDWSESTETPPPKYTPKRQFFRDYDDSSDEEELAEKTQAIDYESTFRAGHNAEYHQNTDTRLFWIIHVLSNRLLYSREVNQRYYQHQKRELRKKQTPLEEELFVVIKNIICEAVKVIAPYLLIAQNNSVIDAEALVHLQKYVLDATDIAAITKQIIADLQTSNLHSPKTRLKDASALAVDTLLKNITFDALFYEDSPYTLAPPKNTDDFFDDKYYKKLTSAFSDQIIIDVALSTIKERLEANNKMTASKTKRKAELKTSLSSLAEQTWKLVEKLPADKDVKKHIALNPRPLLPYYLCDLVRLNEKGWKIVTAMPTRLWLTRYFPMSNTRLSRVIDLHLEIIGTRIFNAYFSTHRPTLGNSHHFVSQSAVELLCNVRLANISVKREAKNFEDSTLAKKFYVKCNPKAFHFEWSFFERPHTPAIETQTVHANTYTRGTHVDNGGSYPAVFSDIAALRESLKMAGKPSDNQAIAKLLRALLQGKFGEIVEEYEHDLQRILRDRLSCIGYLLFGCEVIRNPGSIIIHHMMLDLIISRHGKPVLTWENLLTIKQRMPMAAEKSIERSRYLNGYLLNMKGMIFPYKLDYSNDSKQNNNVESFELLYTSECALITRWLAFKGIELDSNLNIIAHAICQSFEEWFGIDCFDVRQFINIQAPSSQAAAKSSRKG